MNKTAIDDSDDFGIENAPKPKGVRARFTSTTLTISLIITAFAFAADYLMFLQTQIGDSFRTQSMGVSVDQFRIRALILVAISQLSFIFSGIVTIVVSDRWAYNKLASGSPGRIAFEAIKFLSVAALFVADALFLERLYEGLFI